MIKWRIWDGRTKQKVTEPFLLEASISTRRFALSAALPPASASASAPSSLALSISHTSKLTLPFLLSTKRFFLFSAGVAASSDFVSAPALESSCKLGSRNGGSASDGSMMSNSRIEPSERLMVR